MSWCVALLFRKDDNCCFQKLGVFISTIIQLYSLSRSSKQNVSTSTSHVIPPMTYVYLYYLQIVSICTGERRYTQLLTGLFIHLAVVYTQSAEHAECLHSSDVLVRETVPVLLRRRRMTGHPTTSPGNTRADTFV